MSNFKPIDTTDEGNGTPAVPHEQGEPLRKRRKAGIPASALGGAAAAVLLAGAIGLWAAGLMPDGGPTPDGASATHTVATSSEGKAVQDGGSISQSGQSAAATAAPADKAEMPVADDGTQPADGTGVAPVHGEVSTGGIERGGIVGSTEADATANADGPAGVKALMVESAAPQKAASTSSSTGNGSGSASSGTTSASNHTHDWKPVTEKVWHSNNVVVKEAWEEVVYKDAVYCSCGVTFDSVAEYAAHVSAHAGDAAAHQGEEVKVEGGTRHHDAEWEDQGWWDYQTVGYKCSCGAVK